MFCATPLGKQRPSSKAHVALWLTLLTISLWLLFTPWFLFPDLACKKGKRNFWYYTIFWDAIYNLIAGATLCGVVDVLVYRNVVSTWGAKMQCRMYGAKIMMVLFCSIAIKYALYVTGLYQTAWAWVYFKLVVVLSCVMAFFVDFIFIFAYNKDSQQRSFLCWKLLRFFWVLCWCLAFYYSCQLYVIGFRIAKKSLRQMHHNGSLTVSILDLFGAFLFTGVVTPLFGLGLHRLTQPLAGIALRMQQERIYLLMNIYAASFTTMFSRNVFEETSSVLILLIILAKEYMAHLINFGVKYSPEYMVDLHMRSAEGTTCCQSIMNTALSYIDTNLHLVRTLLGGSISRHVDNHKEVGAPQFLHDTFLERPVYNTMHHNDVYQDESETQDLDSLCATGIPEAVSSRSYSPMLRISDVEEAPSCEESAAISRVGDDGIGRPLLPASLAGETRGEVSVPMSVSCDDDAIQRRNIKRESLVGSQLVRRGQRAKTYVQEAQQLDCTHAMRRAKERATEDQMNSTAEQDSYTLVSIPDAGTASRSAEDRVEQSFEHLIVNFASETITLDLVPNYCTRAPTLHKLASPKPKASSPHQHAAIIQARFRGVLTRLRYTKTGLTTDELKALVHNRCEENFHDHPAYTIMLKYTTDEDQLKSMHTRMAYVQTCIVLHWISITLTSLVSSAIGISILFLKSRCPCALSAYGWQAKLNSKDIVEWTVLGVLDAVATMYLLHYHRKWRCKLHHDAARAMIRSVLWGDPFFLASVFFVIGHVINDLALAEYIMMF